MRVIAGTLGGRRLATPRGRSTRPTSDRVREAIFSALGDLEGARVLDLYAGSGALAIEALSRGARSAVAVERARPAIEALRRNVRVLGLAEVLTVQARPVAQALVALSASEPFDLVLADPPYDDVRTGRLARTWGDRGRALLAEDGVVVVEHAARDEPPALAGLELGSRRRYGDTAVSWYHGAHGAPPSGRGGDLVPG